MTDFVVSIIDPLQLEGITWAREQYNAAIPPPPPEMPGASGAVNTYVPPMVMLTSADAFDTDEAYVQWVMEQAAISYADQKLRWEHQQNYESELASRSGGKNA